MILILNVDIELKPLRGDADRYLSKADCIGAKRCLSFPIEGSHHDLPKELNFHLTKRLLFNTGIDISFGQPQQAQGPGNAMLIAELSIPY